MATSNALSCPIKLPPLDGRRFFPVEANTDLKTKTVAGEAKPSRRTTSFKQVLADANAAKSKNTSPAAGDKAEEAGREMEAFLLSYVFKQAFNNSLSSGLFGNSYASHMYLEMFIDAASEEAAKSTPLGIAEMIITDINRDRQSEEEEGYETQELHGMRQVDAYGAQGYMLNLR